MAEPEHPDELRLSEVFAADATDRGRDKRARRIMRRIKHEVAVRDLLLFTLVRIWLTVLETGAFIFARYNQTGQRKPATGTT